MVRNGNVAWFLVSLDMYVRRYDFLAESWKLFWPSSGDDDGRNTAQHYSLALRDLLLPYLLLRYTPARMDLFVGIWKPVSFDWSVRHQAGDALRIESYLPRQMEFGKRLGS